MEHGTLEENKTILDGKETSNMVPWRCVIELQKNNNMKLCHYNSDDNIECGTANYTYEGGNLNIKDNDWYLKWQILCYFRRYQLCIY